ncbi:MAG: T9SS type A sorting domain-containing protein [Bacteroidales bacterium]
MITIAIATLGLFSFAQVSENNTTQNQGGISQESISLLAEATMELKDQPGQNSDEDSPALIISRVYPNPAHQTAHFDFEWKKEMTDAKIIIYNLLGKMVREVEIRENTGTLKINVSDLIEGIYFYSLVVKNQPEVTQKLIIRH